MQEAFMSKIRRIPGSSWAALAVAGAVLLAADGAAACSVKGQIESGASAASACCAANCNCCTLPGPDALTGENPGSEKASATLTRVSDRLELRSPRTACVCRSPEPAAPDSRPQRRALVSRSNELPNTVSERPNWVFVASPRSLSLWLPAIPPKSPLYLLNARLLI